MFSRGSKGSKSAILCLLISWGLVSLVILGNVTRAGLELGVSKAGWRGCFLHLQSKIKISHPNMLELGVDSVSCAESPLTSISIWSKVPQRCPLKICIWWRPHVYFCVSKPRRGQKNNTPSSNIPFPWQCLNSVVTGTERNQPNTIILLLW